MNYIFILLGFRVKAKGKKAFKYKKKGKNKGQKNVKNDYSEEDISKEKENITAHKEKNQKLNKKEKNENDLIKGIENGEKEKLEKEKEKSLINKKIIEGDDEDEKNGNNNAYIYRKYYKFFENFFFDSYKENKNLINHLKIRRRYMKRNKNKLNKILINLFYFFIMVKNFFSQFINYYHRKIEFTSSYINLKINGTGNIY